MLEVETVSSSLSGKQKNGEMVKKKQEPIITPYDVLKRALEVIDLTVQMAETRSDPEAIFNSAALLVDIFGRMTGGEAIEVAGADLTPRAPLGFHHTPEDENG